MLNELLIHNIVDISHLAGDKIMDIYQHDFAIYEKSDESPLTEADLAAHNCIVEGLSKVSDLPILSEESADISWQERSSWNTYWLVDPLDGTKEFIKKNGEFTVNIALIKDGVPIFGVVYAPVLEQTYVGVLGQCAYKITAGVKTDIFPTAWTKGVTWKIGGRRYNQRQRLQALLTS